MASLSLCQFVLRIEFQVKNHFSSELKGITLVVSTFQGSMPHFLPVYSPLVFFLQVLISQFSCSVVSDSCNPMDCSTPVLPVHHQLRDLAQAHVHRVSDTIQPSHTLLSPSPAFNRSQHQGLSNESVLHIRWPKYWSFSFSISPSNEYSGLISFRTDWFDLLAAQGTLKSLLQYHSSKASILQCSAFFIVQLTHPYMTTVKTIVLTRWTFVA